MLNKIIKLSLNNRVAVVVISGLLMLFGVAVMMRMDIDIFPDLNAPTVVVMTEAPGLAPEEVERVVTYPVETSVNGATGVRRVRSSSATGFSVVWIEFDWGTDIYKARQIVTERIGQIAENLPDGVGAPVLAPQSSILGEVLFVGLTSDSTSMMALRNIADRTIRPRLLSIGGVSQVAVIGGDVREFQIQLHPSKMKALDVTLDEVIEVANGLNNNAFGGVVNDYGNEYIVKGDINTSSVDDLANCVVRSDGSEVVLLSDIADVTISPKLPVTGVASINGKASVIMTVTKQHAAGTIELTKRIEQEIAQLKPTLPSDVKVSTELFRQSDFIDNSITNLQQSLFEGSLFVIVILFFFLMNLRTTLISLVSLPMSIMVTIIVLNALGLSINTMILGGIAIAIGSLVDDAIVDVENVYKRLRENKLLPENQRRSMISVVFEASKEVRMPIFNSSLIIIASFLPLFFLTGMEGRMLMPLGISFIVALLASTIVAFTLTPVLCSYLLNDKHTTDDKESWVARRLKAAYRKVLDSTMRHKKIVLGATGGMMVMAIGLFFTLGRSFLPSFNEGSFTINVSVMPGISLEESQKVGLLAEKIIMSTPEVQNVARKTGRAELDEHALGVNVSEIEAPYKLTNRSRDEVMRELRSKLAAIPGANIEIGQPISHRIDAMLSGSKAQIAIKVFGDNLNELYTIGSQIKQIASDVPGIVDLNIEQQVERPQLKIRPRREMLARYGIPINKFAEFINVLGGVTVSQVYENGLPYDLTLRVNDADRSTLESLSTLMIDTNQGKVPLENVAEIISTTGPNTINRENVSRRIIVSANVDGRDIRSTVDNLRKAIDSSVKLPEGYSINYSGQFESEAEASRTLALASIGALIIIMLLLYSEFKNWTQTLIILVNMPLAMIGGVLILRLTSGVLNIPAIIGFISLLGITTRNGMLLMSHYNQLSEQRMPLKERIMTGSIDRLLPILMTALSSLLALIPISLKGSEPGNEIQSPMAIVILGGLVTSTVLNVFITPVLYYLTSRNKNENNED